MAKEEQSETGRRPEHKICTFLADSSSPLFYTVGTEKPGSKSKYYIEQLGAPSILKPFRDLPGTTRLSTKIPSCGFALEKLSKTIMGKSPPTEHQSKRFTQSRADRFMSPIKVNAKIRHIYSHITTTTESSSFSASSVSATTQTDFGEPEKLLQNENEEDTQRDAFTSMTPPPEDPLFSIPVSYARKLEDLEKITGHIVIQRFFTKADQAFGVWLEKQLGMNSKSVGVGESLEVEEVRTEKIRIKSAQRESVLLEKILEVDDVLSEQEKGIEECGSEDNVKCECFLEDKAAAELEEMSSVEQKVIDQCAEVEVKKIEAFQIDKDNQDVTQLRLENKLVTLGPEIEKDRLRPCIPDVIEVSQFQTMRQSSETETSNEDMQTVVSMTENQLEVQDKVAQYLDNLEDPSQTSSQTPTSDLGRESQNQETMTPRCESSVQSPHHPEEINPAIIKRSQSVDSCIGTESSGERMNDSGILLDSGRLGMVGEENEISFVTSEINMKATDVIKIEEGKKLSEKKDTSLEEETISFSRSDRQLSDEGGDADIDDSETNSESEFSSLRKPLEHNVGTDKRQKPKAFEADETELEVEDEEGEKEGEDDDDDAESDEEEPDQFDTIIEAHEKEKRLRPIYRKRNTSTQTTKSVEESSISSRSTTASESSFDLEFVSKTKKYISHIPSNSKASDIGLKKRSYLPTSSSGLNVLNMRFSLGREFESEVSIRIPPQITPGGSASSSSSFQYQLPNAIPSFGKSQQTLPIIGSSRGKWGKASSANKQAPGQDDPELKSLWRDVKSKMESKVENEALEVRGSKIEMPSTSSKKGDEEGTKLPILITTMEQEQIKRSLKRIQKILDE